jgi:hypothetical protein
VRSAQRWIIERTNAWLQNYRRILVGHDRLVTTYRAFVVLVCVITLGALLKWLLGRRGAGRAKHIRSQTQTSP